MPNCKTSKLFYFLSFMYSLQIILKIRLMEEISRRSLSFTTFHIYLDHEALSLVSTDANGIANLTINTAIKNLDLQIIETGPNFSTSPVFEIFDENNVLKRSNVSVNILPRMVIIHFEWNRRGSSVARSESV